jgi:transposase-like protein
MTHELESVMLKHKPATMRAQAHDRGGKTERMSVRKLYPDERRAAILAALQPGANKSAIARRYGISRPRIYQLLESALTDPKEKLREAEREAEFRRRVLELTR